MYLNVGDVHHELGYCDRTPNERNLMQTLTWSLTVPSIFLEKKLCKALFRDKNLKENKVTVALFRALLLEKIAERNIMLKLILIRKFSP